MRRKTKPKAFFKTSVAQCVKNPIKTDALQTVLEMVNVEIPPATLNRWTVEQRALAEDWAIRLYFNASDNCLVRVPEKPRFVTQAQRRLATMLPKPSTGTIRDLVK